MSKLKEIHCPTCKKPDTWQATNPFKPFCSERCKLIDLGEWASEKKLIAGEENNLPSGSSDDTEED